MSAACGSRSHARSRAIAALAPAAVSGCTGLQSALDPGGPSAREISVLWWSMAGGAVLVLSLVLCLLLYAIFGNPERRRAITPHRLIVGGGMVLPVAVLSMLVPFNVRVASGITAPRSSSTLTIRIEGRQWWWDVEYDSGRLTDRFTTANEIYIPVGEPVELVLTTADVIHSLWFPGLGGKLDMIPGRTNRLMLEADRAGVYRGQCAEFCGIAHAKMALYAVAVPPQEFSLWAERQRAPGGEPEGELEQRGAELFDAGGCALCHTLRGRNAWGREGPDLTHVGGRLTIGAGLLDNTPAALAHWIAHNDAVKPGNRMPDYADLDGETRAALAAFLAGLE